MLIYTDNVIIRAKILSMHDNFRIGRRGHPILNKRKQIIVENLPLNNIQVSYVVNYLEGFAEFDKKMVLLESPGTLIVTEVNSLKKDIKELPKTLAVDLDLGEYAGIISVKASIRTIGLGGEEDMSVDSDEMFKNGSVVIEKVNKPTTCAIE